MPLMCKAVKAHSLFMFYICDLVAFSVICHGCPLSVMSFQRAT